MRPWWFNLVNIYGYEETEEEKAAREAAEKKAKEDEDEEDEDEEDDDYNKIDKDKKDTTGLKSALEKERKARRQFEREVKALKRKQDEAEDKDKSDTEKATKRADTAEERNKKLATRLRESTLDNVITKLATKLKFRDIDDALKLVDRTQFIVEQDDDEPEDIEVDEKSIETALKELQTAKPHLIVADGDDTPSGSKFNNGRTPKVESKESEKEKLLGTYPALRRGARRP